MGYERLNLKTGEVITEDVFKHLEDGIVGASNLMLVTPIVYADLVALRDADQLKAGMFYRITDYITTTTQENTRSAGHPFDIIVLALDESTLSEDAKTCVHEGDTYFTENGANLSAWKIKYALDNDAARFAWADAENGKGVIYRMIDEWDNDCPYDFKNILFKKEVDGEETYIPTFADDLSGKSHNNIIRSYKSNLVQKLNFITFGVECYRNTFDIHCHDNIMGKKCHFNTFGEDCINNTFGESCHHNSFGYGVHYNTFGLNFCYSTFGNIAQGNIFGVNCGKIRFGNICNNNVFGDECSDITSQNMLINCSIRTKDGQLAHFCSTIQFGNNCIGVTLQNDATASSFQLIQNIRILGGVRGTIEVERNLPARDWVVGVDESGTLTIKALI